MNGYSKRIGDSHRENVSSLLLNYKELAEYERENSLGRLETTVAGLKEKQKEKRVEYLKALKNYDEYVEKNTGGNAAGWETSAPADQSKSNTQSAPADQSKPSQPESREELLYRELVRKARAAYEESVYIERTHRIRMLETSMRLDRKSVV